MKETPLEVLRRITRENAAAGGAIVEQTGAGTGPDEGDERAPIVDPPDKTLAVEVRTGEPQHVADAESEISEGQWFGLEQCDDCGNTSYRAVMHGGRWFLVCTPNPDGIYAGIEGVGRGAEYPVREMDADEVTF